MRSRAASIMSAVLSLALVRAGPSHALSLRSSAAESFLGDAAPGAAVVFSQAAGGKLRVENSGEEEVRVEFRAVDPPRDGLKDGCEPWPDPGRIRVTPESAELKPGQAAEVELAMTAPKDRGGGGQYQFDVLATGKTRAGASLTLRTRVLTSVGPPLAHTRDEPDGGWTERPGFELAPKHAALDGAALGGASGVGVDVKVVNAGEEDLTVSLTPARDWDKTVKIPDGESPAPDPRWLTFDSPVLKVRAGAIGRARIKASIPREARYAGRRWAFVVAADAAAGGRATRRWFVLSVRTRDMEEEMRAR